MAVPKRKTSPSKRGMRRSADALKAPTYVEDKNSGEMRRPHHIDLKTGMYRGRQVLDAQGKLRPAFRRFVITKRPAIGRSFCVWRRVAPPSMPKTGAPLAIPTAIAVLYWVWMPCRHDLGAADRAILIFGAADDHKG